MKKLVNGKYIEITAEELAIMQSEAEKHKDEIPEQIDLNAEVKNLKSENENLKQQVTDLELALVELYENTEV